MMHYTICSIPYAYAMELVIQNHYLHRRAPCSYAFGLFDKAEVIGCITYGSPASRPLCRGICGPDQAGNVLELTRLWIRDDSEKNAESFLIGNTLPMVDKEIIVSFAEIAAGHVGVVYQATNWIYTGLSAKRTNWTVPGDIRHCRSISHNETAQSMRDKYGDAFTLEDRPRKHRYVFFNAPPRRRKYLKKLLRYPVLPYPKARPE
jgi:hypothetical protein